MREVTVIFKSGATASFTVEEFATFKNGFGALTKIEYTGANKKVPFHIGLSNIDAIFVEDIGGKESTKEPDHPIEDVYGDEIMQGDVYYKFGDYIVLEYNLKPYLIERQNVECFRAV
ncbi:hypothetical protein P9Y62_14740 [Bacillus thuringiensis]|uniref:Uncharacterized protein n=4 Tax=Bacillus cereus group TaxID=86661 RepID=A0A643MXB0_BACTU|nr:MULTISPECIES: hypothetical protein [Bacillus cereus group]EEM39703.1 hypothetical protein bthur0004_43450 [Bacillus thuringiensis serovar sotto str. T04001]AFQ18713.1 hypothetical protein BTG_26570 [Bacillus thuringiensis HD-771]AHZ54051.1 hypothetical protein YBT1520_27395 [Bacillus thuringiensis serovar kurstaki str. YBT-1520]AIM29120.1 hypothetical protein DF16_orf00704 [Bacillus thuringiensis serovar kurstaki str. YBT-1520]KAB1358071.1 hypothetical protein FPG90_07670 [Bacillus thuringi